MQRAFRFKFVILWSSFGYSCGFVVKIDTKSYWKGLCVWMLFLWLLLFPVTYASEADFDFAELLKKSQQKLTTFSGQFYDFYKKICRFLQEKLTVFTGKCKDFLQKNLTVFTGTFDDLPVKTVEFSRKNRPIFFKTS